MNKFFRKINKNKKGFTLIETLVALSVFIISIVGIMSVLASGLSDINSAKKKMTATFLAQEGIEYVRNIRDTYVLYPDTEGWDGFLNTIISFCENNGCYIDTNFIHFNNPQLPILKNNIINPCSDGCPVVYYDENSGKYNSGSGGKPTAFIRTIRVEKILSSELKIISKVTWGNNSSQSITLTENLFNWHE